MMHSVHGRACGRLHCGKGRRSGKGQLSCQGALSIRRVAAGSGWWPQPRRRSSAVMPQCLSTGHGEVADLVVSRQEQSLRAATAARSAVLRVMPMKVEQRDGEVGSEGGGGGRDNGEGSSRSDGVAVRAWLTPRFRRREWSSGRSHRSKLGAGWRGMICFSGPSRPTHLPQRNHMRPHAHRCMVSCRGTGLKARGLPAGC